MSKVLKSYSSDYKIATRDSGTITLDTGENTGTVFITGSLEIKGDSTTIDTTELKIEDNVIVLSQGTEGSGLPSSVDFQSGIEIDRGSSPNARWIYDEEITWTLGGTTGSGTFYAEQGIGAQKLPLNTPGIVAQGNLYIDTGNGVISVTNTPDYEEKIFNYDNGFIQPDNRGIIVVDDDNIPNAKAVRDYVDYSFTNRSSFFVSQGDSKLEVIDETHVLENILSINDSGNNTTVIETDGQHGLTELDTVDIIDIQANGDPLENLNSTDVDIVEVISPTVVRLDISATGADTSEYIAGSGTLKKSDAVESRIAVSVEGIDIAEFYDNRFSVDGIEIGNNTISLTESNEELILKAPGVGSVVIDDVLEIPTIPYDDDPFGEPISPADGVKLFSKQPGTGKVGLYYVNNNNTTDEIVSKNRSLLFSMLF